MRLTQIKSFLLFLALIITATACKEGNDPDETIRLGDRNSVFGYFRFDNPDLPLTSETVNGSWNSKNFSSLLDLNEDGSFDINLFYNQLTNIDGTAIYYSALNKFNSSFVLIGQNSEVDGAERWTPKLFVEGEEINLSKHPLGIDSSESYISYVVKEGQNTRSEFNAFPVPQSDAYLIFKIAGLNNREIMGWLHIEQLEELKGIRLMDVGYKYIN